MFDICLHHGDMDGICSAAIVAQVSPNCEFYSIDYQDQTPWHLFDGKRVIIVDFTLQPFADMFLLKEMASRLVWIDHHKSQIQNEQVLGFQCEGIRREGDAGCELTWEFFFPEVKIPRVVTMLGRYDVWKHNDDPNILMFQLGAKSLSRDPNSMIWEDLLRCNIRIPEVIEKGRVIQDYFNNSPSFFDTNSFPIEFEGINFIACNREGGSKAFSKIFDPRQHDAMLTFIRLKDKWKVVMYSENPEIDLSVVAAKYGSDGKGGGHRGAAGFICYELPFKV